MTLVRSPKSRVVDWAIVCHWGEHETKNLPIPDYAYDKHSRKGRTMGRGWDHFFEEGSRLENHEIQPLESEYAEKSYTILTKARKPATSTQNKLFEDDEIQQRGSTEDL